MTFTEKNIILHKSQNKTENPFHIKGTVTLISTAGKWQPALPMLQGPLCSTHHRAPTAQNKTYVLPLLMPFQTAFYTLLIYHMQNEPTATSEKTFCLYV